MKAIMQKTGMAVLLSETANGMVFHVQRKGQHSGLHVDIFMVLKNLHMVEIRRGKGDAIAYYKFMFEIGPRISKEIGIRNQGPSGIVVSTVEISTDDYLAPSPPHLIISSPPRRLGPHALTPSPPHHNLIPAPHHLTTSSPHHFISLCSCVSETLCQKPAQVTN